MYFGAKGLSYAIREQEVGTDNFLQTLYCKCCNWGEKNQRLWVPNYPPDGAGRSEIISHGRALLAKGALSAMSH